MANNPPSSPPTTFVDSQDESPFTSAQFDLWPALPEPLPEDPSIFTQHLDHEIMSKYEQLQQENDRMKAELVEIRSQRQGETIAYGMFIKSIESLNTQLPPQVKTSAMRLALRNLVDASSAYRNQAQALNQRYDQIHGFLPPVSPGPNTTFQSLYPVSPTNTSPSLKRTFLQDRGISYLPQPSFSRLRYQDTIAAIKNTLGQLQISRPRDLQPFEAALAHLQNNIASFAPFIVLYLNGRYKHVTSKIRPQVHEIIGGFFDDPGDAKLVVSNVVKVLRENVKYVEQDVQGIGSDLIGPMGMVLWALVGLLEQEQH